MFNGAGLEGELNNKIWAEYVMNDTYLSNIISEKSSLNCPFELLYGETPTLQNDLNFFCKVRVVTTREKIQSKLSNQEITFIFAGYTEHH
jgi:hypothetical protein